MRSDLAQRVNRQSERRRSARRDAPNAETRRLRRSESSAARGAAACARL